MTDQQQLELKMNNLKKIQEEARFYTKEEAIQSLREAGILDENGEFTKPYENLGRWVKENSKKN